MRCAQTQGSNKFKAMFGVSDCQVQRVHQIYYQMCPCLWGWNLERIIPTIPKSLALWDKSYANNTWYLKTCTERTAEEIWGLNQLRRGKWRCETSQTHGELVIIDLSLGASHRSRTESPILGAWTSHLYGWPTPKSWSKGMFHQIENQRF